MGVTLQDCPLEMGIEPTNARPKIKIVFFMMFQFKCNTLAKVISHPQDLPDN
jgi:hypothetical protein